MKSFIPAPRRMTLWRCPDCEREESVMERGYPGIFTFLPASFRKSGVPVCPKCRKKMIQVRIFY